MRYRSAMGDDSRRGGGRGLRAGRRRGVAAIDYVLLLGVVLPLTAFLLWAGPRLMNLVYEMTCVLVSWPFL